MGGNGSRYNVFRPVVRAVQMSQLIDLTGQRFGRLVVIKRARNGNTTGAKWECQCDCGKQTISDGYDLRQGKAISCGCSRGTLFPEPHFKHGCSNTKLYREWAGMKSRCYGKSSSSFKCHGGRGISVCEEWLSGFAPFKDWALKNGFCKDLTLDRINNDGNYEPSNCRWITNKEQSRNKQDTIFVLLNGVRIPFVDAVEQLGLTYHKAWYKMRKGERISDKIRYIK